MTEKENYLKMLNGEQPEWVPTFSFNVGGAGAPTAMVGPRIFRSGEPGKKGVDCWGVTYVPVDEAGGGKVPEPGNFILKDISKWREVIKRPNLDGIDFEAEAKSQLANINRNETAVIYDLNGGVFQLFISFMGFSEGLCAMYEDPDEVRALMEYCSDFIAEVNERCIDYYKPDLAALVDDTATWANPFISVEMYRDIVKPFHARQCKIALDHGALGIDMHDCGRCEDFIDDWLEMGVVSWNPAQTSNDLVGIKRKYGNRLILEGCWDARDELLGDDVTEEQIKESVRKTIDTFAPGGGYMFMGFYLGAKGDQEIEKRNKWIEEAVQEYGRTYYQTHTI